ncbi:MAG: histidine kinase [Anaerolineae bacterium]|nr:histidine kinase [Anaerolineae bacterium]
MDRVKQRLLPLALGPSAKALLAAAAVLMVLLCVWWYAVRWYEARLLSEERVEALAETSLRGNALSLAINRRLARLQGLYAFVQVESAAEDLDARFEAFAEGLYAVAQGIRYLAVAPAGTVRYVYPQRGNETLLGYDMLQDPRSQVRADTERAIESRHAVATGPVELFDGGLGLIARQPVYQGETFWGLVAIVLDVPVLLQDAGLTGDSGEFDFALRDSEGQVFFGPDPIVDKNPVLVRVQLSEETWELASIPVAGWGSATAGELLIFEVGGLVIVALLAGLAYLSVNRQARLAEAVRRRTGEISSISEQYRSIFESTSDGLLIFDLEGRLVDFNPAASHMHDYTPASFAKVEPKDLIHPTSMPLFDQLLERVRANEEFHGRGMGLHQDGTPFHVEVDGTRFVYRGEPHALAVVRDVTEEVQAYQLLEQRVQQRTHELATLLDASASIASTLELRPLLGLVLDQLGKVVDCAAASILLLEGGELRNIVHRGCLSGEDPSLLPFVGKGDRDLWTRMLGNEPLIVDDIQGDGRLARALRKALESHPEGPHVRAWMGIPFTIQEQLRGWLFLYHRQAGAYTSHQAALAQTIAHQAATAIENAHLFAQTRRLAALEERQRLARELHDSVSQVLYSIGLAGHTALTYLEQDPDQAVEPMRYVLSLADAGLAEMRALIFELRPDSLEKDGLVVALTRQAAALRARHELEVKTELCQEPDFPLEVKEALYRIAREALNNVVKHAQASRVVIRLPHPHDAAVLEVQDDGVGFDPQREYPGQMGLNSMRERAAELRGALEIESAAGEGTCLRVRIPAT